MKLLVKNCYDGKGFWDIVKEWEFEIAKCNGYKIMPFTTIKILSRMADRFPSLGKIIPPTGKCFSYELGPWKDYLGTNKPNIVPCIIDFHTKDRDKVKSFIKDYCNHKVVCVSNLEVVSFLSHFSCPFKVEHLALSLPDKYRINTTTVFEKKYDVVMLGRTNPVLTKFLNMYLESHPQCTYIKSCKRDDKFACIDKEGKFVGYAETREEYINMIRKCRVALYGTPGLDGDEVRTGGFNQVTPKFLEYIACGCHVIARYPKNADTDFYEMEKISPSVESYEQFEKAMDTSLSTDVNMSHYSEYLEKHYTSVRARKLQEIMKTL